MPQAGKIFENHATGKENNAMSGKILENKATTRKIMENDATGRENN